MLRETVRVRLRLTGLRPAQHGVPALSVLLGGNASRRELGVEVLQLVLPGHR